MTDDLTFWPTMAQVSATFIGLVFVALSIYLESIRSAVREIQSKYPLKENSSRLMYSAILSNLSLFILPLLASLTLILEQEHPQVQFALSLSVGAILTAIFFLDLLLYRSRTAQEQFRLLRSESRVSRKLLQSRVLLGAWGLPVTAVTYGGLLFALQSPQAMSWAISLLKIVALLSVVIGLGIGLFDLVVFSPRNILFRISENLRRKTLDRERTLKKRMNKIDYVWTRWRDLASDPQFRYRIRQTASAMGLDPDAAERQLDESWEKNASIYNALRTAIPSVEHCAFAERILSGAEVLTLKELQAMTEEVERLFKVATEFLDRLSEDCARWENWKESESRKERAHHNDDQ